LTPNEDEGETSSAFVFGRPWRVAPIFALPGYWPITMEKQLLYFCHIFPTFKIIQGQNLV
jgi:hypothetical protein